ncbi:3'-5' exoribonuclease 1 [Boothiomyces sp. JEL0866]|nr:3'-5' exoribonuclease 1 [Boothiomyces sp. JEL0866]
MENDSEHSSTPNVDKLVQQLNELGITPKKTLLEMKKQLKAAQKKQQQKPIPTKKESYDYYLVFDVEATCQENSSFDYAHEIIEFPVILVKGNTYEIEKEFHRYVKPKINPQLSDFCTKLTGITQDIVDNAQEFAVVFQEFLDWLSDIDPPPFSNCIFVTDGIWDLRDFIEKELVYNQIRRPEFMFSIIDLRKKYREFYTKSRSGSLNDMLSDLGMTFEGREHSGIDDARNIAKIFIKMAQDGCKMDMTTNMRKHKATKGEWSSKRK